MSITKRQLLPFVALILTLGAAAPSVAGSSAEKLERAGYMCFPAGPNDWIHCWKLRDFSQAAIAVKVFSVDGMEFLGTELLIHEDHYNGHPCPQDGGEWAYQVVLPYYACHHFYTGHHD